MKEKIKTFLNEVGFIPLVAMVIIMSSLVLTIVIVFNTAVHKVEYKCENGLVWRHVEGSLYDTSKGVKCKDNS